jgi:hypothetical protein
MENLENNEKTENVLEPNFEVDTKDFSKYWQYLINRQNLLLGIITSLIISVLSLIIWTLIIKFSGYKVGWMALVASFGIAFTFKHFGKGITPVFGIVAGAIAFFTWIIGNFLTATLIFSKIKNISFFNLISKMDINSFFTFLGAIIGPVDFIIGMAAIFTAYYFGYIKVSPPQ